MTLFRNISCFASHHLAFGRVKELGRLTLMRSVFCAAVLGLIAGCGSEGPKFVEVTGTVTLDGNPLKAGTVMFFPTDGPASTGPIIDGKFRLYSSGEQIGAVPGKHQVAIMGPQENSYSDAPAVVNPVPERYLVPETSGLEKDVAEEGENVISIELTTKPS